MAILLCKLETLHNRVEGVSLTKSNQIGGVL